MKKTTGFLGVCLMLAACSAPPKPQIPALTQGVASQALQVSSKAANWIAHAKKQDPSCVYQIDIPDQSNQPTELDFTHIVKCGGRNAPLELDASVTFEFDSDAQHWVIRRFSD
jgi:hypothetical protein